MSPRRFATSRQRAARVLIALAAAAACLGAVVAYAASRSSGAHQGLGGRRAVQQPTASVPGEEAVLASREALLRPQLIEAPPQTTSTGEPQFRFHVQPRKPAAAPAPEPEESGQPGRTSSRRFQCRLDGEDWSECRSPRRLTGLVPGSHHFAVRVFNREGRAGEAVDYEWRQTPPAIAVAPGTAVPVAAGEAVEPQPFSIVALRQPENLYPGLPPTAIPVRIANPNDVAIEVTEIAVAVREAPANCRAENFELTPAGASPADPLLVPAGGSVDLPATGTAAPTIRMVDLPVEQDACRGAEIPLLFSGEAHG